MRKPLAALIPLVALGPISGPLVYGLLRSLRQDRPVMASVYSLGILEAVVLLPPLLTALLRGAVR